MDIYQYLTEVDLPLLPIAALATTAATFQLRAQHRRLLPYQPTTKILTPDVILTAETTRTMQQKAESCWHALASSTGAIASDLHSLLLEVEPPKTSVHYMAHLKAQALNQRASNSRLHRQDHSTVRASQTELVVTK